MDPNRDLQSQKCQVELSRVLIIENCDFQDVSLPGQVTEVYAHKPVCYRLCVGLFKSLR